MAAAQRAQASAITRRDPLFTSLAMARLAVNHAELGDGRNTMRYLDLAQRALERADPHRHRHRPTWIDFYDQAELDHLAMLAHVHLQHWPDAEKHAHRSLAYLRPDLKRNSAVFATMVRDPLGDPAGQSAHTERADLRGLGAVPAGAGVCPSGG
ncbi:hypothetical protein ACWELB_39050 [Streptomyces asiaticus]|uniref:hypothetical protein n=1 Tax=Streptomyces asiaticus TaxID=114695 RepID=UPI003D75A744